MKEYKSPIINPWFCGRIIVKLNPLQQKSWDEKSAENLLNILIENGQFPIRMLAKETDTEIEMLKEQFPDATFIITYFSYCNQIKE